MRVTFVADPLVTTMGAVRPSILLAREMRKNDNIVTIMTARSTKEVAKSLQSDGIELKEIGPRFSVIASYPTLDAWARCLIKPNSADEIGDQDFVVNTSSCIITDAHVYYAQGLMTRMLADILVDKRSIYTQIYNASKRPLKKLEQKLTDRFNECSDLFIANSRFCALMYRELGIRVKKVISPPLDCTFFRPSTTKPTADYVLTTFGTYGKEGRLSIVKAVADAGIKAKVFGDNSNITDSLKKHPNVALLGRVNEQELADLYSNALYTLFPFRHEPFGYIPVESMACGTPVLTYNTQGPSETVLHGKTGWLANSDDDMLTIGLEHWKRGYHSGFRKACRDRALLFDTKKILEEWSRLL